ncbi:cytochrome c-type biogenesis protein [Kordiimonas gwangyangensis]|uniref:cytochrome c-type biogenesis protein n=1 Tax=Kordiimonas gwangyangensis TaxID=288022 RepID=UPI0003741E46|nr:cytochrome c-type biogenesis protein [Kordiimonas gwangyangensis]
MSRLFTALIACLLLTGVAFAVAVDEKPLEDPVKEAMARELMKDIRCLVCQNQSIEDSNADLARDLRQIVRERIAMGDSPENVRAYLVDRYGDWVLLEPPVKPQTYFLWASPFLFLALVAVAVARRRKAAPPAPLSADEEAELARIMKEKGEDK